MVNWPALPVPLDRSTKKRWGGDLNEFLDAVRENLDAAVQSLIVDDATLKYVRSDGEVVPVGPLPTGQGGSDNGVAAYISTAGSAVGAALAAFLDGPLSGKANTGQVVDARDFGVQANTSTDQTAKLNDAAAGALADNARLLVPKGTYRHEGTVTFQCNLDADQATLDYRGTGVAVRVGSATPGVTLLRKIVRLPRVTFGNRPGSAGGSGPASWDGSTQGVLVRNINGCEIYLPYISDFERGLTFYGDQQGSVYNNVHLGTLWNNHKQLIIDNNVASGGGTTGWANQNQIIGGRLQQTLTNGATANDTSANQVLIGETAGAIPNGWTFVGTSLEGDNPAYYKVDNNGSYITFQNCRWEKMTGTARARWRANTRHVRILGGYDSNAIEETWETGATRVILDDGVGAFTKATNSTAPTIDAGSGAQTITGWAVPSSPRCPYDADSGTWAPRPGRWRITARLTVAATTGTNLRASLVALDAATKSTVVSGGSLDFDDRPPEASGTTMLTLSGTFQFTGAEVLGVQLARHASLTRTLSSTAAFNKLDAEWIGP